MIIVPLTKGKVTVISDEDFPLVFPYKWSASKSHYNWYARRGERRNGKMKTIYMHRVIAGTPKNKVTHHEDTDSLNNCRDNLVDCSRAYNTHIANKKG